MVAPRTMILIDPALDSDPTPNSTSARRNVALEPSRNLRLPSSRTLARFLAEAQAAVRLRGQVAVLLTTDAALRDLNRRFRGKNKPTDVLSFPAETFPGARPAERVVGDVAISVETARRQSFEQGHALSTEVKVLILHGLVHLAGYDHETDDGEMARQEQRLRARLGLPVGLIERAMRSPKKTTADPSTPLRSAQDDRKGIAGRDNCKGGAGRPIVSRSLRKGGQARPLAVPSSRRRSP